MDLLGILRIKDSNGNWVSVPGLKGDTGEPFKILGIYATAAALEAAVADPEVGDVYLVGAAGAYDIYLYLVDGWNNTGRYMPKGDQGDPAPQAAVTTAVNAWLTANVDPTTGYVLDRTLTQQSAAAPADLVGGLSNGLTLCTDDVNSVVETSGKNLIDQRQLLLANGWTEENGVYRGTVGNLASRFSSANGGLIVIGGFKENTRYTLSMQIRNVGSDTAVGWGIGFYIYYTDETTRNTQISKDTTEFATRTLISESNKTIERIIISAPSAPDNIWEIKELQLEEGSSATVYEEYSLNAVDPIAREETETVKNQIEDISWLDFEMPSPVSGYIRYSDGGKQNSNTSNHFILRNKGYNKVKFYGYATSTVLCAIAFYSGPVSSETYLKANSVAYSVTTSPAWVEAIVPQNAEYIVFCTASQAEGYTPAALYDIASIQNIVKANANVQKNMVAYYAPFVQKKIMDHLFIEQVTSALTDRIIIPCQSVFHVAISARLGFKIIECNTQATATPGKYIVTHGNSGKFGKDFETVGGESVEGTAIDSLTYDYIRENIRYISQFPQYRVPPTSLEEFLYACRENDMFPLLQYRDDTMLDIAKGIIGNNMILYNGNHDVFDGLVSTYHSYTTKQQILAQAESIGAPYIYGMSNPNAFTDEELADIVESLHKMGCYLNISSAYTGMAQVQRCYKFGFDCDTAGKMVPPFEEGNVVTLTSGQDFTDFTTSGTTADGKLTLSTGQSLNTDSYSANLLKYTVKIMFTGTLKVDNNILTSDGKDMIVITGYRLFSSHSLWIIAQDNAEITMLKYAVSKV